MGGADEFGEELWEVGDKGGGQHCIHSLIALVGAARNLLNAEEAGGQGVNTSICFQRTTVMYKT